MLLFWRSNGPGGNYAARMGDWKFVRLGKSVPELYNLASEVGESKDLAAGNPDVLAQLTAAVEAWDKENIAPLFESPRAGKPKRKK